MPYVISHQLNSGETRPNVWNLQDPRTGKDLDVNRATEAIFDAVIRLRWVWGVDAKGVGYCVPERMLQGITVAPMQDPPSPPLEKGDEEEAPLWARQHVL